MLLLVAVATMIGGHTVVPDGLAGPRTLRIVVGDSYLRAPETIAAGSVRIRFASEGRTTYQLQIARVPDGRTADDAERLITNGEPVTWVRFRPAGDAPLRRSGDVVTQLEPGQYLLVAMTTLPGQAAGRRLVRRLTVTVEDSASHLALGCG